MKILGGLMLFIPVFIIVVSPLFMYGGFKYGIKALLAGAGVLGYIYFAIWLIK